MINISTIKKFLIGIPIGIINVTLGAGGGIISVPILKAAGMTQKQAQANTIAIIVFSKLSNRFLSVAFSFFMIYAGIRLLFK